MILTLLLQIALAIEIPVNLSQDDREKVTQLLGIGSSSKLLSPAAPLGGHIGLEVGLAIESIDAEELNSLGNEEDNDSSFEYPKISVGKGLFHHIDVFIHFVPYNEQTGLSEYGAIVKWTAHEFEALPVDLALVGHFNSSNFNDVFVSDTYGFFLQGAYLSSYLDFIVGYGTTSVNGKFKDSITNSAIEETAKLREMVSFGSLVFKWNSYFLATEYSLSEYTSLGAKLGYRF